MTDSQIDSRADSREVVKAAYSFFNARDMDAVLRTMHEDVDWPNGMEGGRVHGHAGVRDYWTRQWSMIDPHVEPVGFETEEDGRIAVTVHQVVRELSGKVLLDQQIEHVYRVEDGLIRSMEIRELAAK
jgi:ketosteroid isomerase-like protein